jgi:CrcB protein
MTTVLWVALGSATGAPARYLLDRFVQSRHERVFPWGTLLVNVTGCFALGLVVALTSQHDAAGWIVPLLGTGFLGGYTTFSTFGWETLRLAEDGAAQAALLNVAASVGIGLGAASLGLLAGSW